MGISRQKCVATTCCLLLSKLGAETAVMGCELQFCTNATCTHHLNKLNAAWWRCSQTMRQHITFLHTCCRTRHNSRSQVNSSTSVLAISTLQVSLLRYLSRRMETLWLEGSMHNRAMQRSTEPYVKRRAPDEIETVLATIDQGALDLMQQSFGS
eukprot:3544328-Amphidinium_carterae.1